MPIGLAALGSSCGVAGRMRPRDAAARRRRALVPWVRAVVAVEAPPGNTTIVLASQHGLAGVNSGTVDLQYLRAVPLIEHQIDRDGIDCVLDEALASVTPWVRARLAAH